eukprot:CAMPEP_0178457062 /NCGR_PEP_ID=MMETSP0689_2-20121128/46818_1 /TAXON_ID=160604 /ORGANISM="Amphidinium massartii, Strain CS-259" /LENGTH=195 /DNA_ID=CAMNT_0020083291 /DNA_START=17 /DNA_END=601 /DNA_ORIENTATION=-
MMDCHGFASTSEELLAQLVQRGSIRSRRVLDVMRAVDRKHYAPACPYPYVDRPLRIGSAATISAPHMHAQSLEFLAPCLVQGARALDVGSGSGYISVCMARLVGETGKVLGIDIADSLVSLAEANVAKADRDLMQLAACASAQGTAVGPFHAIHVGAAAEAVPEKLLQQLAPCGRMLVPVGPADGPQVLVQIDRL